MMETTRALATSAVLAALVLALVGCNQTTADDEGETAVEQERVGNTEVCNTAAWIRERAPLGMCESTPDVDDEMSLGRLHEERVRPGR